MLITQIPIAEECVVLKDGPKERKKKSENFHGKQTETKIAFFPFFNFWKCDVFCFPSVDKVKEFECVSQFLPTFPLFSFTTVKSF